MAAIDGYWWKNENKLYFSSLCINYNPGELIGVFSLLPDIFANLYSLPNGTIPPPSPI